MIDYSNENDRWKLLSKELILKQEVINRNKLILKELSDQLKEKGQEVVLLRSENFMLDQELYDLNETLMIERRIDSINSNQIPPEIMELSMH